MGCCALSARLASVSALVCALAAGPAGVAAGQTRLNFPAAGAVGFEGARLGMRLSEWKALLYPGADSAHVAASCSNDLPPAAGRMKASAPTLTVCRYVKRYGRMSFPTAREISPTYSAIDPTYYFVASRLERIEFDASVDAFNAVDATLSAEYGPATDTLRDEVRTRIGVWLPRVRKVWREPGGVIRLTDPSASANELTVQFVLPASDRPEVGDTAEQ